MGNVFHWISHLLIAGGSSVSGSSDSDKSDHNNEKVDGDNGMTYIMDYLLPRNHGRRHPTVVDIIFASLSSMLLSPLPNYKYSLLPSSSSSLSSLSSSSSSSSSLVKGVPTYLLGLRKELLR